MDELKVNIYGLSEATISFNTIGMMLRGKYSPEEPEMCSFAKNVTITNEEQANELKEISNLKLIRVEVVKEEPKERKNLENVIKEEPQVEEEVEEVIEEKVEEKPSRRGSKKKAKKTKETVEETVEETPEEDPESSEVVVMTETGAKTGKMAHKMNGEIDEEDPRCKASMDAAKELKEEEDRDDDVIDESLLDSSEKMGQKAVIGTGSGKTTEVEMKNSVVADKEEPNFIDLGLDDEDEEVENAFIDEKEDEEVDSAFIDLEGGGNELGDAFIEY